MKDFQSRLAQIRKLLKYGDMKVISEMTGFSPSYVRLVLDPNDKRHNDRILDAAEEYMAFRKERLAQRLKELIGHTAYKEEKIKRLKK